MSCHVKFNPFLKRVYNAIKIMHRYASSLREASEMETLHKYGRTCPKYGHCSPWGLQAGCRRFSFKVVQRPVSAGQLCYARQTIHIF